MDKLRQELSSLRVERVLDVATRDGAFAKEMYKGFAGCGEIVALDLSEKMFEKALSIKPTQFDTLYFLSRIRISQDRVEEAKKMLDTALDKTYSVFNTVPRENAIELARSIGMDLSVYDDIPAEN